jgi:hypothetical protein
VIFNPLFKNAVCLSLSDTMLYSKLCVSSKISGSAKKFIFVPVFFVAFPFLIFDTGLPKSKF